VKYLLDANTCIDLLRRGRASRVAVKLAAANQADVVLCSVVVGELLFGARRSQQVAKNLVEVRAFCAGFGSLPFEEGAAEQYAEIRADLAAKDTPIGPNDLMIAAIARRHGLVLVTHNVSEFSRVTGLTIEDWQV
jgi:tRNA(fMet)-specific endonuclease VapC